MPDKWDGFVREDLIKIVGDFIVPGTKYSEKAVKDGVSGYYYRLVESNESKKPVDGNSLCRAILLNFENFGIKIHYNGMFPDAFSVENFTESEQKKNLSQSSLCSNELQILLGGNLCISDILLCLDIYKLFETYAWDIEKLTKIQNFGIENGIYDRDTEELDIEKASTEMMLEIQRILSAEDENLKTLRDECTEKFNSQSKRFKNAAAKSIGEKTLDFSKYSVETLKQLCEFKEPEKKKQKILSYEELKALSEQTMQNTNRAIQELQNESKRLHGKVVASDYPKENFKNIYSIDENVIRAQLEEELSSSDDI